MPRTPLVIAIGPLLRGPDAPRMEEHVVLPDPAWFSDAALEGETTVSATIDRVGDGLVATLHEVDGSVREECARCLTAFVRSFSLARAIRHYPFEPATIAGTVEDDTPGYDPATQTLDLFPFLREELILGLEVVPHCTKACKGLCPSCGKNLNEGPCTCAVEPQHSPTTPLAGLAELWKTHSR